MVFLADEQILQAVVQGKTFTIAFFLEIEALQLGIFLVFVGKVDVSEETLSQSFVLVL